MAPKVTAAPWLTAQPVAHRGLHLGGSEREENTLPAVAAAAAAGYGVEIDVRITADEHIAVFHDSTLDRLTAQSGPVKKRGSRELSRIHVGQSEQSIPMLADVIDTIAGRVPLFIEVKHDDESDIQRLGAGIIRAMEGYRGPVAVMSFSPKVMRWFARNNDMLGAQLGLVIGREALLSVKARLETQWEVGKIKPHFMACDINLLPNSLCTKWRASGGKLLTWTVRDKQAEAVGNTHADCLIFEEPAVTGKITDLF